MRSLAMLVALPFVLAIACRSGSGGAGARDPDGPGDAQILEMTRVINQSEIDAAKLAGERAVDARVKDFATRMITDHTEALRRGQNIASEINAAPVASKWSQDIQKDSDDTAAKLREKNGADFDKAYIDAMVDGHQKVLDLIRDKLSKQAVAEPLRSELTGLDAAVAAHLAHAKSVKDALK